MALSVSSTTSLPQPPRMRYPSTRSSSPVWVESQVSILMHAARVGQFFDFPGLREITNHQLQVLGLLQHVVAAGGLIAVGDDVARQRGQHVVGLGLRRQRGHAGEGTQRAGDRDGCELFVSDRGRRKIEVAAARAPVLLYVALSRIPIARDQIQHHQAPGGQLALFATRRLPNFFVRLTRRRIVMPVEKLRIGQLGVHSAGLRGALQVIACFGGVAFAFHLPGAGGEIVRAPGYSNTKFRKEK